MNEVVIRPYRPADHGAGRALCAELAVHHGVLYADPEGGPADPGAGFDEYLTRLDLSGVWVAEHPADGVVGLVGLLMDGSAGQVEPVVVAGTHRGRGIGRALLARVADEARRRGLERLTVRPQARNVQALRCLHAAGYDVLSAVELTLDLHPVDDRGQDGVAIRGVRFRS